jgi:hypothetical protein
MENIMLTEKQITFLTLIQYQIDTIEIVEDHNDANPNNTDISQELYDGMIEQYNIHILHLSELSYVRDLVINEPLISELITLFSYTYCVDQFLYEYVLDKDDIITLMKDLKSYVAVNSSGNDCDCCR